jgi:UDP-N-acetylglucosamine--N-acetylmuramyl-(pentapeptide) pyrophosphoryl-undecaprenol N-acetylglucosamine transferase
VTTASHRTAVPLKNGIPKIGHVDYPQDAPAGRRSSGESGALPSGRTSHRDDDTIQDAPVARALDLSGGKVLFVTSTGGHLTELHHLAPAMNAGRDSVWLTFDTEQSRSLLHDTTVRFIPYIGPRGYRATARAVRLIRDIIRADEPVAVVSTGAGVAISAFVAARLRGIPCHYIESVSRVEGPSMTGRLVAALRLARPYTQHAVWADRRWSAYPSVLSAYEALAPTPAPALEQSRGERPQLFVTLGTIRPYRFDALVDAVVATGLADERTVWQLGSTTREDLPGRVVTSMTDEDFRSSCRDAEVVITHAGVGTVMTLLEMGIYPVVVPRRAARGEHVDDHQTQIAALLATESLAEVREADDLPTASVRRVAGRRVRARSERQVA